MATQKFLQLVLPDNGIKVIALATPTKNGGAWFKYKTYDNIDEAAAAATVFDDEGETVYFAVNSFNDWYLDEAKDKKRIRTQENVHSCRSLFADRLIIFGFPRSSQYALGIPRISQYFQGFSTS